MWPRVTMQPTSQPSSHAKTVCCKLLLPPFSPLPILRTSRHRTTWCSDPLTNRAADGRTAAGAPHSIGLPSLAPSLPPSPLSSSPKADKNGPDRVERRRGGTSFLLLPTPPFLSPPPPPSPPPPTPRRPSPSPSPHCRHLWGRRARCRGPRKG